MMTWEKRVLFSQQKQWQKNSGSKEMFEKVSPIITYSNVQSPSWEANWFAASQEIPRISRNPKVHYRIHKRPPPLLHGAESFLRS